MTALPLVSLAFACASVWLAPAARAGDWSEPLQQALPDLQQVRRWQATTVRPFPVVNDPGKPWLKSDRDLLQVDLRSQWSDPIHRDQGEFGTCAAFAAVALFEAAMARSASTCLRLSEADLFMQGQVLKWKCWDDTSKYGTGRCTEALEGASLQDMIAQAQDSGILRGDHYQDFLRAYDQALARQGEWKAGVFVNPPAADWFKAFLADPFRYDPLFENPKSAVHEQLERYAKISRSPDVDAERRGVAAVLRPFQATDKIGGSTEPWSLDDAHCRDAGKDMETFIDGELLQGRPVAVGAYLDGMPLWQDGLEEKQRKLNSSHAFVLDGLRLYRRGQEIVKIYHVRNSWGKGSDYPLEARRICHVHEAASLLVPGERPAPADPWAALEALRRPGL